jgi:outer membrane immunogenic protein
MRRLQCALLATVAAIGVTSIASAADMPIKAPVGVPYNWTGFYVGGNVGGVWSTSKISTTATTWLGSGMFTAPYINYYESNASPSLNGSGVTAGGQVGYNWQSNAWVYGVEADFNYTGVNNSRDLVFIPPPLGGTLGFADSVRSRWLGTVRARIGWSMDRTLLYVTGGLAVANVDYSSSYALLGTGTLASGSISKTKAGWTVGGGVEYALNKNWSAKVEYLYVDLGNTNLTLIEPAHPTVISDHNLKLTENIGRIGINYKFGP